jgi:hypothetical protein
VEVAASRGATLSAAKDFQKGMHGVEPWSAAKDFQKGAHGVEP